MEPDPILTRPPVGQTALVRSPNEKFSVTDRRETDCRTALTRGLKEYLEQLSVDWVGGRQVRFVRVFDMWAEPEDTAEWPSAAIYALAPGQYEARNLVQNTETIPPSGEIPPPSSRLGWAARIASTYSLQLRVEVWANNHQDRIALTAMLEQAFEPVDWCAGFRLHVPHYHGQVARYSKLDLDYKDAEADARRRVRLSIFTVEASVDQVAFVGQLPLFRPSAEFATEDTDGTSPAVRVGSS